MKTVKFILLIISCMGTWVIPIRATNDFVAPIEAAHHASDWREKAVVEANFTLRFGGKVRFEGKIFMQTNGGVVRMERADGAVAVFDGKDAWVSAKADWPKARFDVLTWAYFWAAPYKLNDPGCRIQPVGQAMLRNKNFDTAKLTFASGTGDAPDDWYVLYRDSDTGMLKAMSYIVTFNRDQATAEKEPHAIYYEEFQRVNNIPVSTRWTFWNWSVENGITGGMLGEAKLTNVSFHDAHPEMFVKPAGAVAAPKP